MDSDITQTVAGYVGQTLGKESYQFICAVVANCKMLALELEECFVELYQSLHTAPARETAQIKFGNTLAFLDGVIEHLSDATPV